MSTEYLSQENTTTSSGAGSAVSAGAARHSNSGVNGLRATAQERTQHSNANNSDKSGAGESKKVRNHNRSHPGGRGDTRYRGSRGGGDHSGDKGPRVHGHSYRSWNQTRNNNVEVITKDFSRLVRECEAKRYKVHKPNCGCSKVTSIWSRVKDNTNANANANAQNMNGLVVLPDIKSMQSIFKGDSTTTLESYILDLLGCEKVLRDIIFSSPNSEDGQKIKVSCASCILQVEPNGFLCVSSVSKSTVDCARDLARETRETRVQNGAVLHSDHADYMCTIRQSTMSHMLSVRGGRSTESNASNGPDLLQQHLEEQGVPIYADGEPTIILGHHLKTILDIRKGKDEYILAMVRQTVKNDGIAFEIDLPGGKRHLGESSFECAVRETAEETSLIIDETWLVGDGTPLKSRAKSEFGNVFYLAQPPQKEVFEDIGKNVFWTNTGLGE